jgi:hypothetical protein
MDMFVGTAAAAGAGLLTLNRAGGHGGVSANGVPGARGSIGHYRATTASMPEHHTVTRGVTIDDAAQDVCPWLAPDRSRRGGVYSFDAIENALGVD